MAERKTIAIRGVRYELEEDAEIRAADLTQHRVTLRRVADGAHVVLDAAHLNLPPLAVPDRVSEADRIELRELVEELLARDFDDRWVEAIAEFVTRHRMLRTGS